ncbi:MAG: COX15/CtaA family protein [Actinobacteria bacterium]|nr:COX15/CtaA family protein [Actinomycetota bacterium]
MDGVERTQEDQWPPSPTTGDGTRWLALSTVAATLLLVAVGGYTRGSGSGFGCSDRWPLCEGGALGGLLPRWEHHMVIEWTHRWMASTVGLLALATAVSAWRHLRQRRDVLWSSSTAVVVIGIQAWVGRMVVKEDLDADLVSVHLAISMAVVALVTATAVGAGPDAGRPSVDHSVDSRGWIRLIGVGAAGSLVVLLLGSYVHDMYFSGWPLVGNALLPEFTSRYLTVHFAHRVGAALVMMLLLHIAVAAVRRNRQPAERYLLGGAAAGFALNVGLGAVHVVTEVDSSALIAIHLLIAALVWAQLVAAVAEAARADRPKIIPVHPPGGVAADHQGGP